MTSPHDIAVATWREQSARLIGGLLRLTRDLGLAEDLAHDAMVAALEQWPTDGVPDNPGAWLMTVARRRAVDHHRRAERQTRTRNRLAHELLTGQEEQMPDPATQLDAVEDDALRLMLLTCHPALTVESQVALTLRLVGGLTSREIARALLVPEATVVRRITRAKTTLAQLSLAAGRDDAPLDLPGLAERRDRLPAVMGVVYLVFTEGYAATSGEQWMRAALCDEAIRLARLLTQLAPDEPEAHGLLALLELQASRAPARTDDTGAPVLLEHQDRSRWDQLAIRRGIDALGRALAAAPPGPYGLQAAIAACHARAPSVTATDWATVAGLYDALAQHSGSPIVRLNRGIAHGMAHGPAAGLALLDELSAAPGLQATPLLAAARGDLLERMGRLQQAENEFRRAAGKAHTDREREFLEHRADRTLQVRVQAEDGSEDRESGRGLGGT